jgi:hypothetical protein
MTQMTYQNRSQITKFQITSQEVFDRARAACPALPPASGDWLELHWWSHGQHLDLVTPGGVTYGTKNKGNDFLFLEYEGEEFAQVSNIGTKNYVPQLFKRADGREYWQ